MSLRGADSRTVEIRYQANVRGVPAGATLAFWMPVPVSDAYQRIGQVRFSTPGKYQLHGGANGNRYFHCRLSGDGIVEMTFRARRRERVFRPAASGKGPASPGCCLGSDRLAPIDAKIRAWATGVVAPVNNGTDVDKARAIYNHVIATVNYDKSGKGWGRGDIYYACDARRGNCTDFHAIFIGYSRAVGVPARFAIGLPLPPARGSGEVAGYHCWAEFFARGSGWVPVDASEGGKDPSRRGYFFGAHDENRVEFSRGRDLVLSPPQAGEPLNFFVFPYAELAGKPFDGIQTRVTFRDVAE